MIKIIIFQKNALKILSLHNIYQNNWFKEQKPEIQKKNEGGIHPCNPV